MVAIEYLVTRDTWFTVKQFPAIMFPHVVLLGASFIAGNFWERIASSKIRVDLAQVSTVISAIAAVLTLVVSLTLNVVPLQKSDARGPSDVETEAVSPEP